MKHHMLLLGKAKTSYIESGIDDYLKRLNHYTQFSVKLIKEKKNTRNNDPTAEGALLLSNVPPGSFVIALDPLGKQVSSEEFAEKITSWEGRAIKSICYIIGGPLGLSDEVRKRADVLLSLSRMTFTHDMTRLLLVEQLYRAYTIKRGEKYHK